MRFYRRQWIEKIDMLQMGETRITVAGPGSTAPLPLEEPTQRRPAPQATQSHVRSAAMPTQVTPAPLRPAGTPVQTTPLRQAGFARTAAPHSSRPASSVQAAASRWRRGRRGGQRRGLRQSLRPLLPRRARTAASPSARGCSFAGNVGISY